MNKSAHNKTTDHALLLQRSFTVELPHDFAELQRVFLNYH